MDLVSLKLTKRGVELVTRTRQGEQADIVVEHHAKAPHAPHPDLVAAMANLVQPLLALLELPERYRTDLTVTSVHVSEQKTGRGLVVNAVKTLKGSTRPLNLSSPLLVEDDEGDDYGDFWDAIETIGREAEAYMKGKRAQGELFDEDAEPVGVGAEEDE